MWFVVLECPFVSDTASDVDLILKAIVYGGVFVDKHVESIILNFVIQKVLSIFRNILALPFDFCGTIFISDLLTFVFIHLVFWVVNAIGQVVGQIKKYNHLLGLILNGWNYIHSFEEFHTSGISG